MEQNLLETACLDTNGGVSHKKSLKSISTQTTVCAADNDDDYFDCNICLDSAHEPVVTLCGHLYCWPCIYRWLQVKSSSHESVQHKTCPVCKCGISHTSLVPLYGRGNSVSEAKRAQMGLGIPRRPPPYNLNSMLTSVSASSSHPGQQLHPFQYQHFPQLYGANGSLAYHGGAAMAAVFSPMIGMFGEMISASIFGSSGENLFSYRYVNSYPRSGNGSPRVRRQEMQVDKSLNRLSVFLLCCIILCLLLF